jgi:tetratricopeptide (TPR) repeat protein
VLGNLGGIHHALGELEHARDHYERALALAAEVGDRVRKATGAANLGLYQEQGRNAEARAQFDLALATAREIGHVRLAYTALCNLGILLTAEGHLPEAVNTSRRPPTAPSRRRTYGQRARSAATSPSRSQSKDSFKRLVETADRGESLLVPAPIRLSHALLLCDRAEIELSPASRQQRTRRCGTRAASPTKIECGPESELRRRIATLTSASVR